MRFPWLCLALSLAFLQAGCADSTETVKGLPVYCLDEPDPGPCGDRQTMYYYDYRTDSCRVFFYGGCGGRVPFETRSACEEACMAGAR
jgi:hypothetical protein